MPAHLLDPGDESVASTLPPRVGLAIGAAAAVVVAVAAVVAAR